MAKVKNVVSPTPVTPVGFLNIPVLDTPVEPGTLTIGSVTLNPVLEEAIAAAAEAGALGDGAKKKVAALLVEAGWRGRHLTEDAIKAREISLETYNRFQRSIALGLLTGDQFSLWASGKEDAKRDGKSKERNEITSEIGKYVWAFRLQIETAWRKANPVAASLEKKEADEKKAADQKKADDEQKAKEAAASVMCLDYLHKVCITLQMDIGAAVQPQVVAKRELLLKVLAAFDTVIMNDITA
jgi:hypothetical protein